MVAPVNHVVFGFGVVAVEFEMGVVVESDVDEAVELEIVDVESMAEVVAFEAMLFESDRDRF